MYDPGPDDFEWIKIESIVNTVTPWPENMWNIVGVDYKFPVGTNIPALATAYVTGADPVVFRQKYNISQDTLVFGPWGKSEISAFGENIGLWAPDIPESDSTFVAYYPKEEVWLQPNRPWPEVVGKNQPIRRISKVSYANDAYNWIAADETVTCSTDKPCFVPDSYQCTIATCHTDSTCEYSLRFCHLSKSEHDAELYNRCFPRVNAQPCVYSPQTTTGPPGYNPSKFPWPLPESSASTTTPYLAVFISFVSVCLVFLVQ